ncbi:hypothetical protein SAMN04488030_0563 [Aliiroseovarius halocynthiae]|uniref:Uncharacterized protein n=1 Tax=Aliiroseovarius halocynthiae TaxID=985055 RepID=A0A545SU94_9RHOB|nr:hypothetical protein [Aliiroseovarius halocynthiae]TQV68540.1 hypothetical protein FIL88_02850 [Aliiroseovarius halocynthiae]SMR70944.1 hypothetical protein SAMN04488030_0563 [Aliiroseovarius halocynthiae]
MSYLRSLALAATLLTPGFAHADEVSDTLKSALTAYEEGDLSYALEELEFAKQLMQEMKTADLAKFLPEAPEGWTREVSTEVSAGMAIFGGGAGSEATYSDGSESFTITIMADNPMVGALSGMMQNAGLMGMKLERVGRMKYLNQDGELSGIVDGRILIQAKGTSIETMKTILTEIDHRALEDFGR